MRFDMILALLHLGYRWLNRDKIGQLFIYAPLVQMVVLEASASRHVMPTHVLLKEYPRADSSKLFPRLNMQVLYLGNNTQQREQQKLRRRFTFTRESFNV